MSTANSKRKGTRLTRADKRQIRREVVEQARRTGSRAYQFAWDEDQKVQITGFPNGRAQIERVEVNGVSIEPRKLLLSLGIPARWAGVAGVALVAGVELARALGVL